MKSVMLIPALLIASVAAHAGCLTEAKLQARIYSANENGVPVSSIRVENAFYVEQAEGVLYYGVQLNNGENVNVGLTKACRLASIDYVTDEND